MTAGTQYAVRFSVPPAQVEFPLEASDAAVVLALVPVLPKNVCRCDLPGCPGKTIGSSKLMCEKSQGSRNAPRSLAFGLCEGSATLAAITRAVEKPGLLAASLLAS